MYDLEEIPVKPPRAGGKIGFGDMGNDWGIKNALVGPAQGCGMGLLRETLGQREQKPHSEVPEIPKRVQSQNVCSSHPAFPKWELLKSLNFPSFSIRPIQINLL